MTFAGRWMVFFSWILLVVPVCAGAAEQRYFDIYGMEAPLSAEARSRVLILGTPHLALLADDLTPGHLSFALEHLESFRPSIIGVESLPGTTIETMRALGGPFDTVLEHFAGWISEHGPIAQETLGVTGAAARAELDQLLAEFAASEGPVKPQARRRAVMLALAGFDQPTAVLQWRYLPASSRKAGDDVPEILAARLDRMAASWNETYSIGVELAHRLGHQRIASIDDHMDKDRLLAIMPELEAKLANAEEAKALAESSIYAELGARQERAIKEGDLWPLYEWMNSNDYVRTDVKGQFHLFFRVAGAEALGRQRSALWEVRNLNIASNVRRAAESLGAGNMLVIIGAGHKPFLETYLEQMMDMEIVEFDRLQKQ